MKALVQRVTRASVTVGDREVSAIGKGLCVLLGISRHDTEREAEWMAKKLLNLRLFDDPVTGKAWDKSVSDLNLEILCVSQFTLCHVLKGNKPDFHNAMGAEESGPMYHHFLKLLGSMYRPEAVKGGEFQAMMQVHIQNDGPVTLDIDSPQLPPPKERKGSGASLGSSNGGGGENRAARRRKMKEGRRGLEEGGESLATAVAGLTVEGAQDEPEQKPSDVS